MPLSRTLADFGLLRRNAPFRRVMIARTVSLLGLGMLSVAVPVQVYALSGSSFLVGLALALSGVGMVAGLLIGGALADRHDRRKVILSARTTCGLGFAGLTVNSLLPAPSLAAVFGLSIWDGLFSGMGVTALTAAMPAIVGRDQLLQARALGVLAVRLSTVISPLVGGAVIATGGVAWAYGGTALATLLTVLTLLGLPALPPGRSGPPGSVWRMTGEAVRFILAHPVVLGAAGLGGLLTTVGAVRALFPALATEVFAAGPETVGLMTAMIPAGAVLAAVSSGWAQRLSAAGPPMIAATALAFAALALVGLAPNLPLVLLALAVAGTASTIAGLLQYSMIQGHTPDRFLGRVNSLWMAQEVAGGSLTTMVAGALARLLSPPLAIVAMAVATLTLTGLATALSPRLRRAALADGQLPENAAPPDAEGGAAITPAAEPASRDARAP